MSNTDALDSIDSVLAGIDASLKRLADGGGGFETRPGSGGSRGGSRFVGDGADPSLVEHIAKGGSYAVHENTGVGIPAGRGLSAVMTKALAEGTGSAGGYLVQPEVSAEVLRMLRARSCVYGMGPRVVPVKKSLAIDSISSGATAYYTAENAQIPVSEQTFAETPLLLPRDLAALVPVSDRLLRDAVSSPSIDLVLRQDLAEVLAVRADLAFLRGTGENQEPRGILNTPGLTPPPENGAVDFDTLKQMAAALRAQNAPFMRPGWIFHPTVLSTLDQLKIAQNDSRYLSSDAALLTFNEIGGGGSLLGMSFLTTTQIPENEIYFSSDWGEAWVAENESLVIEASSEASYWDGAAWVSAFQNRQTLFRAVVCHDIGLRVQSCSRCWSSETRSH